MATFNNIDDRVALEDARERVKNLVAEYADRDNMNKSLKQAFNLEKAGLPPDYEWIKHTVDPSPRNALLGAVRLMTATDPLFAVARDQNEAGTEGVSENVEKVASAMWGQSGRVLGRPCHFDAVLSGLLYGDIHMAIVKTADLVEYAKQGEKRGSTARMKKIADRTPYIFRTLDPTFGYPEYDQYGMNSYVSREQIRIKDLIGTWGSLADEIIPGDKEAWEEVTLYDYWDYGQRIVWIEQSDTPILHVEHDLGFIPIIAQVTDGTTMFTKPEERRMPFLYTAWKSGLIERSNLSMTLAYSLAYAMGSMPVNVYEANEPGKQLDINYSEPGGTATIDSGERVYPLPKNVLDASLAQVMGMTEAKMSESTITRQALGEPPEHALPFQAISLLAQQGRLPLVGVKEMGAWAISDAVTCALMWFKKDGKKTKIYDKNAGAAFEIDPAIIPDAIQLQVELEPQLPIDKLQMANIARMVSEGDAPLASTRWARENFLNIGRSEDMDKEVWEEQWSALAAQQKLFEQTMAIEAMKAQRMQMQQELIQQMQGEGQPAPDEQPAAAEQAVGGQGFDPAMGGQSPAAAGVYEQGIPAPAEPIPGMGG